LGARASSVPFVVAFVLFPRLVPFGGAGGAVGCSDPMSPAACMLTFVDSVSTNALAV